MCPSAWPRLLSTIFVMMFYSAYGDQGKLCQQWTSGHDPRIIFFSKVQDQYIIMDSSFSGYFVPAGAYKAGNPPELKLYEAKYFHINGTTSLPKNPKGILWYRSSKFLVFYEQHKAYWVPTKGGNVKNMAIKGLSESPVVIDGPRDELIYVLVDFSRLATFMYRSEDGNSLSFIQIGNVNRFYVMIIPENRDIECGYFDGNLFFAVSHSKAFLNIYKIDLEDSPLSEHSLWHVLRCRNFSDAQTTVKSANMIRLTVIVLSVVLALAVVFSVIGFLLIRDGKKKPTFPVASKMKMKSTVSPKLKRAYSTDDGTPAKAPLLKKIFSSPIKGQAGLSSTFSTTVGSPTSDSRKSQQLSARSTISSQMTNKKT